MSQNTNWGYIVKNNLLNEVTVPRESDGVELAVSKMQVETDVDNPVLMSKDKATTYIDDKLKASIADAHKVIVGEYQVGSVADFDQFIADYTAGKDHTLSNGRVFNNGNSSPGEVVFITPLPGTAINDFYTEELIVGESKQLINLSRENDAASRWLDLQNQINTANGEIGLKDYSTQVDSKIATEAAARVAGDATLKTAADALEVRVTDNEANITKHETWITSNAEDAHVLSGRVGALEQAEELTDAVWGGTDHGSLVMDINHWKDQNGNDFDFTDGKLIELSFADPATGTEASMVLRVGNPNVVRWAMGAHPFSGKIDSSGTFTVTPEATTDMPSVDLTWITQARTVQALNPSYSKTESDAKYITQLALDIVDKKVESIDLTTKQDAVDSALQTTTKSVVGAINELKGQADIDGALVARIGGLKTTDGDDLSTTVETLVTEKTLTAKDYVTKAEMDAAIAAALSIVMDVTFDDNSAGTFKLGK